MFQNRREIVRVSYTYTVSHDGETGVYITALVHRNWLQVLLNAPEYWEETYCLHTRSGVATRAWYVGSFADEPLPKKLANWLKSESSSWLEEKERRELERRNSRSFEQMLEDLATKMRV